MRARDTVLALLVVVLSGCARQPPVTARTFQGEPIPDIPISPGFTERLAVMDRFRLHDEMRKHMMARPHVWVEELSEEEANGLAPEAAPDDATEAPDAGALVDALDGGP